MGPPSHSMLAGCSTDELLQCALLQLDREHSSKWVLLLPSAEQWEADRRTADIDSLHQCVAIRDGNTLRTLEGRGATLTDASTLRFADGVSVAVTGPQKLEVKCRAGGNVSITYFSLGAQERSSSPGTADAGSGQPLFTDFVRKMRAPAAMPLVRSIKKFITEAMETAATAAASAEAANTQHEKVFPASVAEYIQQACKELGQNPLWSDADEGELEAAVEGVEKYVLCKLHACLFAGCPAQRRQDEILDSKLAALATVEAERLGVPPQHRGVEQHPRWGEALQALRLVNEYKSPFDKMICVSNAARLLWYLVGTEECLPCLLLLVVRARPAHLYSNDWYIARYRSPARLTRGDVGRHFTSFHSVVESLSTLDPAALLPRGSPRSWGAQEAGEAVQSVRAALSSTGGRSIPDVARCEDLPAACVPDLIAECGRLWAIESALRAAVKLEQ
eukprot:Hpha_TRINITY_DN18943_c0_g1::TRINITY_DN18943_c0_g1_i1::g.17498::m.17498/K20131/RABGEF1; Rab5 GDP/GTP exchange factor